MCQFKLPGKCELFTFPTHLFTQLSVPVCDLNEIQPSVLGYECDDVLKKKKKEPINLVRQVYYGSKKSLFGVTQNFKPDPAYLSTESFL